MISLRRTALLWLSGLILVIGAVSALVSYLSVESEMNGFLDGQLRQIAYYVGDVPRGPLRPAPDDVDYDPEDDFLVQIWDASGSPVRASDPTVAIPARTAGGFSSATASGEDWRVFTAMTGGRTVQISQRLTVRQEIAADAALRSAVPIAVLIPLAWLLLGLCIDRVMRRLDALARQVAARAASARDPIPLDGVPREVLPLVRAMNGALERQQQAMDRQRRFLSDAAHELRTPLAALALQIENLRSVARGKALLARLDDVEAGARRAARLVAQLLRLARSDGDADRPLGAPLDLVAVMRECVAEIAPLAARSGATIAFAPVIQLPLVGHAPDLKVMLLNLLDNGVRYMTGGGTIEVRARRVGEVAMLEIIDAGPGIPEPLLERVFERFFRAAPPDIEGTGLGLAIAKAIADRHKLTIRVENRSDGPGLAVRLTMPAALPAAARFATDVVCGQRGRRLELP